jgi:hypothetical protein
MKNAMRLRKHRWHGDEVEFQLELELLLEADNFKTRSCVGDWFHLNKRYLNVAANEFILSLYLTFHEKQSVKERMRAVAYSFVYASACRRDHSELMSNQKSVYVGTKDIDAYLAYRKQMCSFGVCGNEQVGCQPINP